MSAARKKLKQERLNTHDKLLEIAIDQAEERKTAGNFINFAPGEVGVFIFNGYEVFEKEEEEDDPDWMKESPLKNYGTSLRVKLIDVESKEEMVLEKPIGHPVMVGFLELKYIPGLHHK